MSKNSFHNIYLTWRKSREDKRQVVGIIRSNATEGVRFNYTISPKEAKRIGFAPYADFPDLEKTYNCNVLDVFALRLLKSERPDIQRYYDFWEIDNEHKEDKFFLLAQTQGITATDNFEFLGDYFPVKGLSFVSEICDFATEAPAKGLQIGDELEWELDHYTKDADYPIVQVRKGTRIIGNVKVIHNRVFSRNRNSHRISIRVKCIEATSSRTRIFVKIGF